MLFKCDKRSNQEQVQVECFFSVIRYSVGNTLHTRICLAEVEFGKRLRSETFLYITIRQVMFTFTKACILNLVCRKRPN